MKARSVTTVVLTVLAYMLCTFSVQAVSHFVINADHYASISIMRANPILSLGILSMVVQGLVFGLLFPIFSREGPTIRNGVRFSWILGAFLGSYIVLAEPGKYAVPSVSSWMGVEAVAAAVQFTLFGVLLGLVHHGAPRDTATAR